MTPAPTPDDGQRLILEHEAGAMLVTGGPGSGKSWALQERFARLVSSPGADPERIALVVRSSAQRQEALVRARARLATSLPDLRVVTVHALALSVLSSRYETLGYAAPPIILSAEDQSARVRELLIGEDPAEWPAYGAMLQLRGFADQVRQFLLRAQEALQTPEDIEERARARGLTGWIELAGFYRRYLDVLTGMDAVDFAGLVGQAAEAARRADVPVLDHLMLDDYQDTTISTEALLAALRPRSLVVAGDAGAHIYSFQGTTDEPLRQFPSRFAGARVVALAGSHRTSGPDGPVSGTAASSVASSVTFDAWHATHPSESYAAIARELRRIHIERDVPWGALAVIVRRSSEHIAGFLRALDDAGIPRSQPLGAQSLATAPATMPYLLALRWLARPEERDALIEPLLTSDLVRLSPAEARGLVRAARIGGQPAAGALHRDDGIASSGSPTDLATVRDVLARAGDVAERSVLDAFEILWRELPSSRALVAAGDPDRDLEAIASLHRAITRTGESTDPSTAAFLAAIDADTEELGLLGGVAGEGAVAVLTAHGASGREFDTVFVVDAVEGNFPSVRRPEPMFDLATLAGSISQSDRNRRRLADEHRLFNVVIGRARSRVVFTASDDRTTSEAVLASRSRFVDALGVAWTPVAVPPFAGDPLSVAEAEASWRRALADPATAPALRLAALDGLLALGADPSTWWYQREWTETGEPLRTEIRVSASRLENLSNCELQFVLGEELGLDTSSSYYAWVGHAVHKIFEDCENGVLARDLAVLHAAADERWKPHLFPSMAVSETFRRLVHTVMLPAWWEEYGDDPALAAEARFEFAFNGATVSGVIDRIGATGHGSLITDYKTGKAKSGSADDVLQLAVYYLAMQEAENLQEFLPVRGVELAFVKSKDRSGRIARLEKDFSDDEASEYEERWRDTLRELIDHVRQVYEEGVIRPNPAANCRYCRFQTLCPLFPESSTVLPDEVPA